MIRLNGVNDPIWELQQKASPERLMEHTVLERIPHNILYGRLDNKAKTVSQSRLAMLVVLNG